MFTELGTHKVYYEQRGEGKAVVFVHGLGGTGSVWFAQASGIPGYRTVTYDWLGSGNSAKPRQVYSVGAWADEAKALCDHLGISRAVFVGHSLGCAVVTTIAARYPDLVSSLALLGPVLRLPETAHDAIRNRAALVRSDGMAAVVDTIPLGALSPATRESRPEVHGLFRAMLLANDAECYAAHCEALLGAEADEEIGNVRVPVLLLAGDSDPTAPLKAVSELASRFTNSRLAVIPNAGHAMQLDNPAAVNHALSEFFANNS